MKFKDLIDKPKPVLLAFYKDFKLVDVQISDLRGLAAHFKDQVDIIKISQTENEKLCHLLKISREMTYFLYNHGKLLFRFEGYRDDLYLKDKLEKLFNN